MSPELRQLLEPYRVENVTAGTGEVLNHGPVGYSGNFGGAPNWGQGTPRLPAGPPAPQPPVCAAGHTLGNQPILTSTATSRPTVPQPPAPPHQIPPSEWNPPTASNQPAPSSTPPPAATAAPPPSSPLPSPPAASAAPPPATFAATSTISAPSGAAGPSGPSTTSEGVIDLSFNEFLPQHQPSHTHPLSGLFPTMPPLPHLTANDPPLLSRRIPLTSPMLTAGPIGVPSTVTGLIHQYERRLGAAGALSSPIGDDLLPQNPPTPATSSTTIPTANPAVSSAVTWAEHTPMAERLRGLQPGNQPGGQPSAIAGGAPLQVNLNPVNPATFACPFPFVQQHPVLPTGITTSTSFQLPYIPHTAAVPCFQPSVTHLHHLSPPTVHPATYAPMHAANVVTHVHPPPKFNGYLSKDIPELHTWYRRVERVSLRQNTHILDTLDDCTTGEANQLIQQLYNQQVSDPGQVKSLFFSHYAHLITDKTEDNFKHFMYGEGLKKTTDETMETFITRFRLALSAAGISELELHPNSIIVRTLVGKFTQGLPEVLEREFRNGNKGVPFATMQELYTFAAQVGRKFRLKRKPSGQPSDDKDSSKSQPNSKRRKQTSSLPHSKQKSKPANSSQGQKKSSSSQQQGGSSKTRHPSRIQAALNAIASAASSDSQRGSLPPILPNVPDWPAPFPVNRSSGSNKNLEQSALTPQVIKRLVGSNRTNKAWTSKQPTCVFCTQTIPASESITAHYVSCKHMPNMSE